MTVITSVLTLPSSPYNGSGKVGIVITNGIPTYLRVEGTDLDKVISVDWFPKNPNSLKFIKRELILVNPTLGTCMFTVTDNYLSTTDRGGILSFRIDDGTTISRPVITFGNVSVGPLWQAPTTGLITG